jgi:hypothetical protein
MWANEAVLRTGDARDFPLSDVGRSKKISLPKTVSFLRKKHQVWKALISGTTVAHASTPALFALNLAKDTGSSGIRRVQSYYPHPQPSDDTKRCVIPANTQTLAAFRAI